MDEGHMMAAGFVCESCAHLWGNFTGAFGLENGTIAEHCGAMHEMMGGDHGDHGGNDTSFFMKQGGDGRPEGFDEMSLDDQCRMAGNHVNNGA